jgi:4'-phosphopantetheinyl transferase
VTAIVPPIRSWLRDLHTRCVYDEIPAYWNEFDVITFLINLGMDFSPLNDLLDTDEKERAGRFRTDYFKKRFTISRSIIKQILKTMLNTENRGEIVLLPRKQGGIVVRGNPGVNVSLSYSGTCMALSIGKRKLGCDIEVIRPMCIRKTLPCPLFHDRNCKYDSRNFLHRWTLVESYAKLHDKNPYSLLNNKAFPEYVHFVSYCLNQDAIVSLALDSDTLKDTLLWLDPESGTGTNKTSRSSPKIHGAAHVRA